MIKRFKVSVSSGKISSKSTDAIKIAEGMWAALLQGSALGAVEQATTTKVSHPR